MEYDRYLYTPAQFASESRIPGFVAALRLLFFSFILRWLYRTQFSRPRALDSVGLTPCPYPTRAAKGVNRYDSGKPENDTFFVQL